MAVSSAWRTGPSQCCRRALRRSLAHLPCAFWTSSVPYRKPRHLYVQQTSQIKWIISGQLTAEMREPRKVMWVSQQLQLLLICGYRVYAWAQGNALMEGGLSLRAMYMVGWSLLKGPFSLPGTDLQGDRSSLGVKTKMMLQDLHSLAGGTIKHRETLGERVFQPPLHSLPISLFSRERLHCFTLLCKTTPPTRPSTLLLGKEQQSRGRLLSCTHLTHSKETSYPSSCAVTSPVLRAGEQR